MSGGLKAHIKDGQIVFDEPVDLPEGTKLRVLPHIDPELEQAIEDGFSDFERGDFAEAEVLAQALVAKTLVAKTLVAKS